MADEQDHPADQEPQGDGRSPARSWIVDARIPACLVDGGPLAIEDGLVRVDLEIERGRIAGLHPHGTRPAPEDAVDHDGGQIWPCFIDCHTHLDKGHIWPRAENPDGTFDGALEAVQRDRTTTWSAGDVAARMDFGLRCAYAHGTAAIRTHLDSSPPQHAISWPVFQEMREQWQGRIELQAVPLVAIEELEDDFAEELADLVAGQNGVLGCVTYMTNRLEETLDRLFALATERSLDLDFHVDETLDPTARSLQEIARARLRSRFTGKILCGHCCSLATQHEPVARSAIGLARGAGLTVVSLPMCNLYLQDRAPGRTPRQRGVTLLHELRAAGVPVALASDNTRDPFYGYGDLDVMEVFREAVRIGHLDRPVGDWPMAVTRTPATVMDLPEAGVIAPGAPADLVLFRARHWSELLSRPQRERVVLRGGEPIDTTLPDYRELDRLMA